MRRFFLAKMLSLRYIKRHKAVCVYANRSEKEEI